MAQARTSGRNRWTGALLLLVSSGFDWPTRTERLLGELAHATEPAARCDLVRLLSRQDDPRAEQALLDATHDSQAEVRAEALRGLASKPSQAAIAVLTQALADAEPQLRAAAAEALGKRRVRGALPSLTRVLSDNDTAVRVAASQALGRIGDVAAMVPLATALDDASLEVRVQAAASLGELEDPSAFGVVLAKLRDPTPELRIAVVEALPRIDATRAESALLPALDDPAPNVQLAALRALLALGTATPGLRARLDALVDHATPRVAAAVRAARAALEPAVEAAEPQGVAPQQLWLSLLEQTVGIQPAREEPLLAALEAALPAGESLAVDPLLAWLATAGAPQRARIARLIARARPARAAGLPALLHDADPGVRSAVARGLGATGDPATVPVLREALADPNPAVRREAALALANVVDPSALTSLAEDFGDSLEARSSARERRHARRAPSGVKPPSESANEPLGLALVGSLERLGPALAPALRTRLTELFETALRERDPALAATAARGLGFLPSPRALAALQSAEAVGPAGVRIAALRASVRQQGAEALSLRRKAAADPDAQIASTALIAQWSAGDALDATQLTSLQQGARWPLGPVAAFILASSEQPAPQSAPGDRPCSDLTAPEPLTRANRIASLLHSGNARCLAEHAVEWLQSSPLWPVRLGLACWMAQAVAGGAPAAETIAWKAALARCEHDETNAHVRACCGPSAPELMGTSPARFDERGPPEAGLNTSYRALVMADGRVLLSAADAAGIASWPGLRTLSEENPWHWPYGWE